MKKFVKVMFDLTSGADKGFKYKIGEVNVASNWNPDAKNGKDFGGFNYCSEECILRWLHRGDTIYDATIPDDAENVRLDGATTIYRTNKIIISNPKKVDDELALYFYHISKIPEKSYYKALAVVSIMNYKKTAYAIFKDKINKDSIDEVLEEWNDFISHGNKNDRKDVNGLVKEIEDYLYEVKSDILISRFVDKEPYIKDISNDRVINVTGESGSGKSTYVTKYLNDDNYIVIDTDLVFEKEKVDNKYILELRNIFKNKEKDYLINNFDEFYLNILDYFKDVEKTIVIDSAQIRNVKDYSILKGKLIVIRTSIDNCYNRCIERWKENNKNYTDVDLEEYSNKKSNMFDWYKTLNEFLVNIESLFDS